MESIMRDIKMPGFSKRKNANYFRVIYSYRTPNGNELTRDYRTKSINKDNAILQAKKAFRLDNSLNFKDNNNNNSFKIIKVIKTDSFFHTI